MVLCFCDAFVAGVKGEGRGGLKASGDSPPTLPCILNVV